MDEKDMERRHVAGVIGAGLIAALVAWLGVPSAAQAQARDVGEFSHVVAADTLPQAAEKQ